MKKAFILINFLCISLPLRAGWIVQSDKARIEYSAEPGKGYESFDEALKELADSDRIMQLDVIWALGLLGDETLQNDIFTALERDAPRELKEALKSSGNMHHPKIGQLWKPFRKALLATPTMAKINRSLATYGLTISQVEMEKFELRNTLTDSRRRFHGTLSFDVTKLPNPAMQRTAPPPPTAKAS